MLQEFQLSANRDTAMPCPVNNLEVGLRLSPVPTDYYQFTLTGETLTLGFLTFLKSSCRACSGFCPLGT